MGILQDKKWPIAFALIVMIVGSVAYLILDPESKMSVMNKEVAKLYGNIDFKVAFTETGDMKVFAYVKNNALSRLSVVEGTPDVSNGIVLGALEANMMKEESLIEGVGSRLNDFFGIDTEVIGIFDKTETFVDDVHFINNEQFKMIEGTSNVLFMKLTDNDEPKLFFLLDKNNDYPLMKYINSDILGRYAPNNINGEYYYPVILGYSEAQMMIEENLIKGEGDTLKGFFGRDVLIIGILPKTSTAVDMMHFVPKDFFEKGVLV